MPLNNPSPSRLDRTAFRVLTFEEVEQEDKEQRRSR